MSDSSVHPAQLSLESLLADCQFERTRRQGPGGQHRNKVETAVVVCHVPTGLRGEGSERRSQQANRRAAIARLRLRLALEVRGEFGGSPSVRWLARRRGERLEVSAEHEDYPALLAEALDALAGAGWETGVAAEWLGISSSQLVKLLGREKAALAVVNRQRQALGWRSLR